jgi:hypothetical protein
MDTKDVSTPFVIWQRKLYSPVQATWSQQGGIEGIWSAQKSVGEKNWAEKCAPVGGHQYFNVSPRVKSIQLVNEF